MAVTWAPAGNAPPGTAIVNWPSSLVMVRGADVGEGVGVGLGLGEGVGAVVGEGATGVIVGSTTGLGVGTGALVQPDSTTSTARATNARAGGLAEVAPGKPPRPHESPANRNGQANGHARPVVRAGHRLAEMTGQRNVSYELRQLEDPPE